MTKRRIARVGVVIWVAVLFAAGPAVLATEAADAATSVDLDPAALTATVNKLAWMAGMWTRTGESGKMQEFWLAPSGGLMLGLNRAVFASGKTTFEYLRIEGKPGELVLQASPGGGAATPFRLVEIGEQRVVFSNPDHDFPQRILYWREGDVLHARIEGETPSGEAAREWTFERKARRKKKGSGD
jgi:hypothetical protein